MNLLIASTRQFNPESEWRTAAIKRLVATTFPGPINWVAYDQNPDLRYPMAPKVHRVHLHSNSFRHETLAPFAAVILAGDREWTGHSLENLYGVLAKQPVPLLGFGLSVKDPNLRLTAAEATCLQRSSTLISVSDLVSAQWFEKQEIQTQLLPSPTVLCAPLETPPPAPNANPRLLLVLEDTQKFASPGSEADLQELFKWLVPKTFRFELAALNIDDFMRFSSMFPNQIKYSSESSDYYPWFQAADLIITFSRESALVANAFLKPAILIDRNARPSEVTPFIYPADPRELTKIVADLNAQPLATAIFDWKLNCFQRWASWLGTTTLPAASPQPRAVEAWS